MSACSTKRTSGLSMPMPKATVATITTPSSCRKTSWLRERVCRLHAGVIGQRLDAVLAQELGQLLGLACASAIDDAALAGDARRRSRRPACGRRPWPASPGAGSAGRSRARTPPARGGTACARMSARVAASAVAVNATVCTPPSAACTVAERQVFGPEVVAPLRDAMRLVDRQQRDLGALEQLDACRASASRSGAT